MKAPHDEKVIPVTLSFVHTFINKENWDRIISLSAREALYSNQHNYENYNCIQIHMLITIVMIKVNITNGIYIL